MRVMRGYVSVLLSMLLPGDSAPSESTGTIDFVSGQKRVMRVMRVMRVISVMRVIRVIRIIRVTRGESIVVC